MGKANLRSGQIDGEGWGSVLGGAAGRHRRRRAPRNERGEEGANASRTTGGWARAFDDQDTAASAAVSHASGLAHQAAVRAALGFNAPDGTVLVSAVAGTTVEAAPG